MASSDKQIATRITGYARQLFTDGLAKKYLCNEFELVFWEPVQALYGHRFCKLCLETKLRLCNLKSKDKDIRLHNVKRTLKGYKDGLGIFENRDTVSVKSVLKYVFQYSDSTAGCLLLSKIIEAELVNDKCSANSERSEISSSYELYKLVAKTQFHNIEVPYEDIQFDENKIETLVHEYKDRFNQQEWQNICWFENHFSKSVDYTCHEYEEIVSLKYSIFQSILSVKACGEKLLKVNRTHIRENTRRTELAENENNIELYCGKRHIAPVLDADIFSLLQKYCGDIVQSVISFDTVNSKCNNSVQVVIEILSANLEYDHSDLCKRVFFFIQQKHSVYVESIYFVLSDALKLFINGDNAARFHLRDEIENKRFHSIYVTWKPTDLTDCHNILGEDGDDKEFCNSCFSPNTINRPLSLSQFDILQEWYLEIPPETQVLFETFVNRKCMNRAKESKSYARQKVEKMYRLYESLLHVYNKNFIGVFQQANTESLLIEYKCVTSAFDVTSASGATTSLPLAEAKLKEKADDDLCYYNTYLRSHALYYDSVSGPKKQSRLRDCHLILMLDNLVRWKFTADPNPGESRSSQLCALPITLQGLPFDSKITETWHQHDCDGSEICICKHPVELSKGDVESTLLEKTQQEENNYTQFFRLMTWTNAQLWRKLPADVLDCPIEVENTSKLPGHCDNHDSEILETERDEGNQEDSEDQQIADIDLMQVLQGIENETSAVEYNPISDLEDEDFSDQENTELDKNETLCDLEKSFGQMSVIDSKNEEEKNQYVQEILSGFGFHKFYVPPLLCRHPPPASGRDDDMFKIKEILDDTLKKMGYTVDDKKSLNRILCGPDNKIGKSIIRLIDMDPKYKSFLPEFPLLHLRKSKITVLFSAYKDAGLIQLLKFMRDDDQEEWTKLVSVQHIDTATRYVKRIAISLHLAFLVAFSHSLSTEEQESFIGDMESNEAEETAKLWATKFENFLQNGSRQNATFALHADMMKHCSHVVAIALAERLGGPEGYSLLTSVVKESLPFSFVNNASSYAPFCVKILYHHASAGYFHQCLKQTLLSTPFRNSTRNFACDTKRELDHIAALKGFRSGSNLTTVTCRMSLIDSLNETKAQCSVNKNVTPSYDDNLGWGLSEVDEKHIIPTTALILRQDGLSTDRCELPINVYMKVPVTLPLSTLDVCSYETGKYLLLRYVAQEHMFGMTEDDIPPTAEVSGPKELVLRAKRSKGVTIKRTIKSKVVDMKSERQIKEEIRQKKVAKETKLADCFSSDNNACQALLKPDSSKPKVVKSLGMQRALKSLLVQSLQSENEDLTKCMDLNLSTIPESLKISMKICVVEFAGVKFKLPHVKSGKVYLQQVEVLCRGLLRRSNASKIVICEEKYSFTPDEFKAGTRDQRKVKSDASITHLKTDASILNMNTFQKDAITKTENGKQLISRYLAENVTSVSLGQKCDMVIDSELYKISCDCLEKCTCPRYCTPIICSFDSCNSVPEDVKKLKEVKQTKGEAEKLQPGDSVVSFITSGDIDAVYIHLYTISMKWDRNQNGRFLHPVYVVLQKPKLKFDIYNITFILEILETRYCDRNIGIKVALGLCMGGNDFLPKFQFISHETILNLAINCAAYRQNLFSIDNHTVTLRKDYFENLAKDICCPKKYDESNMSFESVRQITIGKRTDKTGAVSTNDPKKWLPPKSAIARLADLVQLQIDYISTAGNHDAPMPCFLNHMCLKKNASGEIEYDFGPESHFENFSPLPSLPVHSEPRFKRQMDTTPQKGCRRKRVLTSTPKSKRL